MNFGDFWPLFSGELLQINCKILPRILRTSKSYRWQIFALRLKQTMDSFAYYIFVNKYFFN